uniref:Bloodthirsty-related gene family, member 1 n=1 Tax=Lates calcarifer TaxID=8187 RepID=A0A4W6E4U8_LATCA
MAMALPTAFLSEDQFTCSICLEVFNNPVSTPCGHSFCQACISSYWDGGGGTAKSYQCPLCKESFRKRPELHINRTLKEITEQFKQIATAGVPMDGRGGGGVEESNSHPHHHPHSALSPPPRPGEMPGSIFAEMMTRFQQLQASGMPHASSPHPSGAHQDLPPPYSPPRRYTLSGPSESSPSLSLCPVHLRGLEFFCRTDNTCVCSVCVETEQHRGHNVIPAKREWYLKKVFVISILERERKVEEIQNSLKEIQVSFQSCTMLDYFRLILSKLCDIHFSCSSQVIEMTHRAAEHRAQSLLRELGEEIAELKKRSTALSQLAVSEDYIDFLKTFPALSTPPQAKNWSNVSVSSELTSGVILSTVNPMMERFQEEMRKLPEVCKSSFRPRVKLDNNITLDSNTAHPRLIISADGKQVLCGDRHQLLPDSPERFDRVVCVLAHQGFSSGRHYWEVEVGGKTDWDLGVASHSVNRKGKITVSPAHGYWFLSLRDRTDYAFRTEPATSLTVNLRPSRIGIYVDCDKGLVSFYNVEARVPCTNKSGRNEAPLIICPVAMTE